MSLAQLRTNIVNRFGVTPAQAEIMIKKAAAKSALKHAVGAATRGEPVTAADDDDFDDPQAWRAEVQKRMQALEIIEEGVKELKDMQKLLKRIIDAENKLISKKTGSVNKKDDDWWDMQHSGWAMGGREMFAQKLYNVLNGLDESKLASYIMDHIGFKRSIPIDEDDIAPLVPNDLEPGQAIPAFDEDEPPPEDAEGVEAMLVKGAKRKRVEASWYKVHDIKRMWDHAVKQLPPDDDGSIRWSDSKVILITNPRNHTWIMNTAKDKSRFSGMSKIRVAKQGRDLLISGGYWAIQNFLTHIFNAKSGEDFKLKAVPAGAKRVSAKPAGLRRGPRDGSGPNPDCLVRDEEAEGATDLGSALTETQDAVSNLSNALDTLEGQASSLGPKGSSKMVSAIIGEYEKWKSQWAKLRSKLRQ